MPAFLIGPNGPVQLEETFIKPCPECDGVATTLVQHHQKTCNGTYGLCGKCHEWYVLPFLFSKSLTYHCSKCSTNPKAPPTSTSLFDLPPQEYWGWRIEYRLWVRYTDKEDWTEWNPAYVRGTKTYYMSERAAKRAFERKRPLHLYGQREYRIARFAMKQKVASKKRR